MIQRAQIDSWISLGALSRYIVAHRLPTCAFRKLQFARHFAYALRIPRITRRRIEAGRVETRLLHQSFANANATRSVLFCLQTCYCICMHSDVVHSSLCACWWHILYMVRPIVPNPKRRIISHLPSRYRSSNQLSKVRLESTDDKRNIAASQCMQRRARAWVMRRDTLL